MRDLGSPIPREVKKYTPTELESIKDIFNAYDKDGDGSISLNELIQVFRDDLGKQENELSSQELSLLFKEIDNDKDGKISFMEFFRGYTLIEQVTSTSTSTSIHTSIQFYYLSNLICPILFGILLLLSFYATTRNRVRFQLINSTSEYSRQGEGLYPGLIFQDVSPLRNWITFIVSSLDMMKVLERYQYQTNISSKYLSIYTLYQHLDIPF